VHATSPRITELELALQATWDRDRLAVYADELQQLGDPRGELIAIDLHRAREPRPDLADRRDELHALVFGSSPHVTSELGFAAIELHEWSDDDTLAQLLAGAAGPYLGAVDLGGLDARIVRNLKLLAAAPRPWLRRIAVTTTDEIDEALDGAGLVAMWPHLAELDLVAATRTRLFRALRHPNIRTLRVTGWQALEGTAWPAVERLDLAYGASVVPPPALSLGDAAALPALRELDLSRNEPSTPDVSLDRDDRFQGGELEVFPLLADYDAALLARVALLRLPSLRTLAHVRAVQDVLDRMPALERVEIARVYPGTPPIVLRHPRAELAIPAPCPWPALDTVAENAMLAIEQVYISIPAALAAMERHYARMPLAAREAWDDFWDLYRNTRREFVISAAALHRAAAALEELDRHRHAFADELVDVLRGPAIADQRVTATHVVY
jgi:hypothetical protein